MQHRPFPNQPHHHSAAEWETPFAPAVVAGAGAVDVAGGAAVRPGARRAKAAPSWPPPADAGSVTGTPTIRLAALYRMLGLREDPLPECITPPLPPSALVPAIAEQAVALAAWMSDPDRDTGPLAIVTGPARSGRTTLLHAAGQVACGTVQTADLAGVETVTDSRFLQEIVRAFGAEPVGRNGLDLVRQIRDLVTALAGEDSHPGPMLAIDGADLAGSRLDLLRSLLTPPDDTPGGWPLRIVVTGTPEFRERVLRRGALASRLGLDLRIARLDEEALAAFIAQRIDTVALDETDDAGMDDASRRATFSPEAIAIVTEWSDGIVGPAIALAGECLLEAIARGTTAVDRGIAHDVAREFTDRAREVARHRAASPFIVPAVQARLVLPFPGSPEEGARESSRTTTPARSVGR